MVGRRINNYEIVSILGQGAMGEKQLRSLKRLPRQLVVSLELLIIGDGRCQIGAVNHE